MNQATIEAERPVLRSERALPTMDEVPPMKTSAGVRREPDPTRADEPGLLWRVLCVVVGAGLAITGFSLMLTAILAFIGLPLFFFGLALMQSAEG